MNQHTDPAPETRLAELEPVAVPETAIDTEARFASLISPLPDGWAFSFDTTRDTDGQLVFMREPAPGHPFRWFEVVGACFMRPGFDYYWDDRIERKEAELRLLRHLRSVANGVPQGGAS